MKLQLAETMAKDLMGFYGLGDWNFTFDNAVRRLGLTRFSTKTISLSAPCTTVAVNPAQVLNTILHEIAHALVGVTHGHDDTWRLQAISIGCDGQRCTEADPIPGKYAIKCLACNTSIGNYMRRPKADKLAFKWHSKCGRSAKGQLQVVAK
jgi:hypothetical protein